MTTREQSTVTTLRGDTPRLRVCFQVRSGPRERYQEIRGAAMLLEIPDASAAPSIRDRIAAAIEREFAKKKG